MVSATEIQQEQKHAIASVPVSALRWVAIGIFAFANVLNFLDRQLLAALGPAIKGEFHLSNAHFGALVSAFSLVYAAATPLAGLLVDRVGLNAGATAAVAVWSLAGMATGLVRTPGGLMMCRGALGLGEAGGLPFLSKANATYLRPSEWGLASALGSLGVTAGSIGAPLLAAALAPKAGWRPAFVIAGALGVLWIAVWRVGSSRIGVPASRPPARTETPWRLLTDARMWRVMAAYALVMVMLMVWLNWTTIFLVNTYHLSQAEANHYFAWIPPVFVALGGFSNGWLAFRWIGGGMDGVSARARICKWCAPLFLVTAAIPLLPSAVLAIGAICVGLFACQCVVGSLNIMPVDFFGPGRAAFSISLLACAYSLMQVFISPMIGASVDRVGFGPVCIAASLAPILGIWIVRKLER